MDPFVGKWKISSWEPDTNDIVPQGIPENGFLVNGPLDIMRDLTLTSDSYNLEWLNENSQPCSASGLQLAGEDPPMLSSLNGSGIIASFAGNEIDCNLTLGLDPNDSSKLTGVISLVGPVPEGRTTPDVGSGTFTATANPDPPFPEGIDAPRRH